MSWINIVLVMMMVSPWMSPGQSNQIEKKLNDCVAKTQQHFVVPDTFNGIITAERFLTKKTGCIIFLKKDPTGEKLPATLQKKWLQMMKNDDHDQLSISKWHIRKKLQLIMMKGDSCTLTEEECTSTTLDKDNICRNCSYDKNCAKMLECTSTPLDTKTLCENSLYEERCTNMFPMPQDRYIINLSAQNKSCLNCNRPVKKPDAEYNMTIITEATEEEELNPSKAVEVMNSLSDFATTMNVTSAEFKLGGGVSGVIVKETDPGDLEHVLLAYATPDASPNIIDSSEDLHSFSRTISVPKEAFEKSLRSNITVAFTAVCRFNNMAKDEKKSTVLGNEVLAIEMGTMINNLTDKINISVHNMKYEGIPTCHSWNGQGSKPNWTDEGCVTVYSGDEITCQCSHLTFFAILLAPPNETISSFDLNNLTVITQVGCGLSMLFLGAVLFMHFLLWRPKASNSIIILIHLVVAIFLLDLTFLINHHVESLDNSVGCKIMAAVMHYFLLATFTWFAVQALHLCLQMNMGGKVEIHHYILKVSISSWGLPVVVVVVLLSVGKYGAQDITTSDTEEKVTLCWITDNVVHWIVNIGYYALVFLFTLTTFIIISSQLFCHRRVKTGSKLINRNGPNIIIVLGLCCILGITWGFVFFAHGVLRIPAYYIFTVLSSFQGFFLFIYYYKTRHQRETDDKSGIENTNTSSTVSSKVTSTSKEKCVNPYIDLPDKK